MGLLPPSTGARCRFFFGFELAKMIAGIKLAGIKSQYSIVLSRSQEKDVEKKSSFAP
jgi:hypothetical protein